MLFGRTERLGRDLWDLYPLHNTCITGQSGEQAHDANMSQYQVVALNIRRVTEENDWKDWLDETGPSFPMGHLETQRTGVQGRIRGGRRRLLPGLPWKTDQSELDIAFLPADR